jgi:hypothetical protein
MTNYLQENKTNVQTDKLMQPHNPTIIFRHENWTHTSAYKENRKIYLRLALLKISCSQLVFHLSTATKRLMPIQAKEQQFCSLTL